MYHLSLPPHHMLGAITLTRKIRSPVVFPGVSSLGARVVRPAYFGLSTPLAIILFDMCHNVGRGSTSSEYDKIPLRVLLLLVLWGLWVPPQHTRWTYAFWLLPWFHSVNSELMSTICTKSILPIWAFIFIGLFLNVWSHASRRSVWKIFTGTVRLPSTKEKKREKEV